MRIPIIHKVAREGNVFIGYQSGMLETGSNKLYIENSDTNARGSLVYGEFDNDILAFNASVGIGTTSPTQILHLVDNTGLSAIRHENLAAASTNNSINIVHRLNTNAANRIAFELETSYNDISDGTRNSLVEFKTQQNGTYANALSLDGSTVRIDQLGAGTLMSDANGNLSASSDIRLKAVTGAFDRGLEAISRLDPITYYWNAESGLDMDREYAGFSAQDVQEAIPEAGGQGRDGFLTLSDRPIIAALVNGMKELKDEDELLCTELRNLRQLIENKVKE